MKRLLTILALMISFGSNAKETITIVYSFSAADVRANGYRALATEANKAQDKYNFIVDAKPGAGGYIASKYVETNKNTVLGTTSAFFVRREFYPDASSSTDDFREILVQSTLPMSVASIKYSSWDKISANEPITIGVTGLGVVSHLLAIQVKEKYPNAIIVPFKSGTESLLGLLGGSVDLTVGFVGEQHVWAKTSAEGKQVTILGVTGTRSVNGIPTLVSKGFPKVLERMDNSVQILAPTNMPESQFNELRAILYKASKAQDVTDTFGTDLGSVMLDVKSNQLDGYYKHQIDHWGQVSKKVKADQR